MFFITWLTRISLVVKVCPEEIKKKKRKKKKLAGLAETLEIIPYSKFTLLFQHNASKVD